MHTRIMFGFIAVLAARPSRSSRRAMSGQITGRRVALPAPDWQNFSVTVGNTTSNTCLIVGPNRPYMLQRAAARLPARSMDTAPWSTRTLSDGFKRP